MTTRQQSHHPTTLGWIDSRVRPDWPQPQSAGCHWTRRNDWATTTWTGISTALGTSHCPNSGSPCPRPSRSWSKFASSFLENREKFELFRKYIKRSITPYRSADATVSWASSWACHPPQRFGNFSTGNHPRCPSPAVGGSLRGHCGAKGGRERGGEGKGYVINILVSL